MHKPTIALVLAAFAAAAPAQQAFECANPDVLNSLVFNARAESKVVVKRSLPDIVAGFRAPSGFTLIGSGVRGQGLSTVVAYKTIMESSKALDSLLTFLAADGWKREAPQQGQQPMVTVARPPTTAATLCRDSERRNLLVQEIDGVRYATISASESTTPRACNAPLPQQDFQVSPMARINAARDNLPQFSLPETARMATGAGSSNIMAGDGTSTAMRIESPDTAASLASRLGRQLTEQGWRGDAEWKGALSTGSTWSRKGADGKTYWGTLQILNFGAGSYEVGFSVSTAR